MTVKWLTLENSTGERSLKQHAYKHKVRKRPWTHEEYNGNKALCSKVFASDDGEVALSFDELESEPLSTVNACKTCMRIVNKFNNI